MSDITSTNDETDEAFVLQQNEVNQAINDARKALYKESGETECATCGDEIPPERKRLVPSAIRCAGCATAHEKKLKLTGSQRASNTGETF